MSRLCRCILSHTCRAPPQAAWTPPPSPLFSSSLLLHAHVAWPRRRRPQALFNLGYVTLVAFRRAGEAEALFARSLAIREAALGPDHPFTVATRTELHACRRAAARAQPPAPEEEEGVAGGGEEATAGGPDGGEW